MHITCKCYLIVITASTAVGGWDMGKYATEEEEEEEGKRRRRNWKWRKRKRKWRRK
jgi:hypothetical protein